MTHDISWTEMTSLGEEAEWKGCNMQVILRFLFMGCCCFFLTYWAWNTWQGYRVVQTCFMLCEWYHKKLYNIVLIYGTSRRKISSMQMDLRGKNSRKIPKLELQIWRSYKIIIDVMDVDDISHKEMEERKDQRHKTLEEGGVRRKGAN